MRHLMAKDIAVMPTPCDGNCFIWSIRRLTLGNREMAHPASELGQEDMREIRNVLRRCWIQRAPSKIWQDRFELINSWWVDDMAAGLCTPPKKPKRQKFSPGLVDLSTPPGPDPKKRKVPPTIGEGRPAVAPQASTSQDESLQQPGAKKQACFLEPTVPDLNQAFSAAMLGAAKPAPPPTQDNPHMGDPPAAEPPRAAEPPPAAEPSADPANKGDGADVNWIEIDVAAMDVDDLKEDSEEAPLAETQRKRRRKASGFRRSCWKKVRTKVEEAKARVANFFAEKGITYGVFMQYHRRNCDIGKAGCCTDGGFPDLRDRLRTNREIKCKSCISFLKHYGITVEDAQRAVDGDPQEQKEPQPENADGLPEDRAEAAEGQTDGIDEEQAIQDLMKTYEPHIVLVEGNNRKGYEWGYRCKLCCTLKQPNGKINSLVKRKLSYVKHYLAQHVDCPTHRTNLAKWKLENEKQGEDVGAEQAEAAEKTLCQGLSVGDDEHGSLHHYFAEYRLWASYANFACKQSKHKYWCDLSQNKYFIKHEKCKGILDMPDGLQPCSVCRILAEPRKVQRAVVRFIFKYHAARLLHAKFFLTELEVQEMIKSVTDSCLGKRRSKHWKSIRELHCTELQTFVRKSFSHYDASNATDNLLNFVASIVAPCLKLSATSVSAKIPALSMQFLAAMENHDLNEMERLNLTFAAAAVSGKLDANPFLQGVLAQCIRKLDKEARGKSTDAGRYKDDDPTTQQLVTEAALQLSILGNNSQLAKMLGQNARPPPILMQHLEEAGLPNPMLALLSPSQMEQNFECLDQQFAR